ncbi:hypothetical protein GYMLUDRAFT_78335 [Collybiopsis luxurians FD-317 M1]|uniref:Uncharacterized protein n=1 Tax=Collybiopsis luxurians FD-317 M1 TaxID=944289 RepID=A0A0D0BNH6_9AGAR|nr:hypothetical protein GYMLUDRAFT_78335 [Collybiopsis luxurians FD-317 M1]
MNTAIDLLKKPDSVSIYNLRVIPISLECCASLYGYELEETRGPERAQTAYEEERVSVEDE